MFVQYCLNTNQPLYPMRKTNDDSFVSTSHRNMLFLWLTMLLCFMAQSTFVQAGQKKAPSRASIYSYLPDGYQQVGTTQLYYRQSNDAIDMMGFYDGNYYSSTYSDYGYKLSVQVGDGDAVRVDCINGTTIDGVTVLPSVEQQGELARICYTVSNTTDVDLVVSLGTHADVMIGNNDAAPISRRKDTLGETYGLTMKNGYDAAQLCVLFGNGLAGVTAVDDFWFGQYSTNSDAYQMVGNYSEGGYYMEENSSYDSGMGWCWKKRTVAAGSTVVFAYLIGVGDVNLEPNSSFEVTPDDPTGWNDLSRPHRLSLNGSYESPAGLDGVIEYAVEDSEEWTALTGTLASGDNFTATIVATFDATKETHVIRFRTRDLVGNTTMLHPIEYPDVSSHVLTGVENKTFTGDSLYQTLAVCDLGEGRYVLTGYRNNVNAGTASFNIEGVFPYTIGRRTYTFTISPQVLTGDVVLTLDGQPVVYNGQPQTPDWQFSNESYANLEADKDYTQTWSNNTQPGLATLTVTGKGNYAGELTATFNIDKAQLTAELFMIRLPETDITYDGDAHEAIVLGVTGDGIGEPTVTYLKQGDTEATTIPPTEPGDYTVYVAFAEGDCYYGMEPTAVGTFTIYQFSAEEWGILQTVLSALTNMEWAQPWDVTQGMKSVASLQGLTIEKGHVIGLNLRGQNLTGMFPYTVLALPQLKKLDLSNNNLTGDIGLSTYAFAQKNPNMMTALQEIDLSQNQLTGNIGIFANCFPSLTSLIASNNCLEDVIPMIPTTVTTVDVSAQTIARVVSLNSGDFMNFETLATKIPTVLLYNHELQTYITSNHLQIVANGDNWSWGMDLGIENGKIAYTLVNNNVYYGESGDTLNVMVVNPSGGFEGSSFRVKFTFEEGDGNFDGQVSVLDLQTDINYILENYSWRPYNFTAANLWQDETINVQDVICMVNKLMETDPYTEEQAAGARRAAPAETAEATVYVCDGQLVIDACRPVAAFDITLRGTHAFTLSNSLERLGIIVSKKILPNGIRLIGYAMNGATLPIGMTTLGSVGQNVATVHRAMLADSEANAVGVSYEGGATGILSIDNSQFTVDNYYDLQGRRVSGKWRKGVYIKKGYKIMK